MSQKSHLKKQKQMLVNTLNLDLFTHTDAWKKYGEVITHENFFMLRNFAFALKAFLVPNQPYRLQEGKVLIVKRGKATYTMNMVDYEVVKDDVIVFLSNTLIEKQGQSEDFEVDCLSFDVKSPSLPNLSNSFIILHLTEISRGIVDMYFNLLWTMAQTIPLLTRSMKMLLISMVLYIYSQVSDEKAKATSHREQMINRFVNLVSQNAHSERNIPFYADKLCVVPHYLSTLVKESTGHTVMFWINKAAVKEIMIWLTYSDEPAAEIAKRMNFSNPSSLSKFFKRETGMSPSEYRARTKPRQQSTPHSPK
ncbi:MAG: AraC family transcriptional regulator [Prevotella sp.]|nr:AraC family transcriptional regulator [Prevotella sp.]